MNELEKINKENDAIFNDLIKKQSDEAKLFNEWGMNLKNRINNIKFIEYFFQTTQLHDYSQYDIKDVMRKFKDNLVFIKPLVEED